MIRKPDESRLSKAAGAHLARFRATSAAMELAEDTHTWELETTSWFADLPARLTWRNEMRGEKCFTIEESGVWTLTSSDAAPVEPNPDDSLTPLGRRWEP